MATITIPNFLTEKVVNGLNTYQYTALSAAMHIAKIRVTKPSGSGMTISIQQNGSTKATVTLNGDSSGYGHQNTQELAVTMNCSINDTIAFVLTSSTASDEQLNSVVATLNIHIGSGN
jgi:hypothetical protein